MRAASGRERPSPISPAPGQANKWPNAGAPAISGKSLEESEKSGAAKVRCHGIQVGQPATQCHQSSDPNQCRASTSFCARRFRFFMTLNISVLSTTRRESLGKRMADSLIVSCGKRLFLAVIAAPTPAHKNEVAGKILKDHSSGSRILFVTSASSVKCVHRRRAQKCKSWFRRREQWRDKSLGAHEAVGHWTDIAGWNVRPMAGSGRSPQFWRRNDQVR